MKKMQELLSQPLVIAILTGANSDGQTRAIRSTIRCI